LVVDWGLAKPMGKAGEPGESSHRTDEPVLKPSSASGSADTMQGSAIGTPQYMSPEQAAGRLDQLGPASDIYSLGATLYCLLTGKPPIQESDHDRILDRVRRGDFPPPGQVARGVPRALEAICLKAMALDAGDRYATAEALAEDVERWLADEPVAAYREPLTTRAGRWMRRHKPIVAGIA